MANRPFPKLAYKYYGPYKVLERVGKVVYRLELPEGSLIHHVFHVSQLKQFVAYFTPVYTDLPSTIDLEAAVAVPKAILQCQLVKKGASAIPQVLIHWSGLPEASATWEDYYIVKQRYPKSFAWGQADSSVRGDVTHVPKE